MATRDLTKTELTVLREVRRIWGHHNAEADVFFASGDEAWIFAKGMDGSSTVSVNLTNLGNWRADGTLTKWGLRESVMGPLARSSSLKSRLIYFACRIRGLLRRSPDA